MQPADTEEVYHAIRGPSGRQRLTIHMELGSKRYCLKCGYDVTAALRSPVCPECGGSLEKTRTRPRMTATRKAVIAILACFGPALMVTALAFDRTDMGFPARQPYLAMFLVGALIWPALNIGALSLIYRHYDREYVGWKPGASLLAGTIIAVPVLVFLVNLAFYYILGP